MNSKWEQVVNNRKRRRSERKSGGKKQHLLTLHEVTESDSESVDLGNIPKHQDNMSVPNSLPGMVAVGGGVAQSQSTTTTINSGSMTANTSTTTATTTTSSTGRSMNFQPNIPISNPFSALGASDPRQSQFCAFTNPGAYQNQNTQQFNMSERNLSAMGNVDSSTALILSEIQAMRAGVVKDITEQFEAKMHTMYNDISGRFEERFKSLEGRMAEIKDDNTKIRQEFGRIPVEGSLQGDTLQAVVDNSVKQSLVDNNVVTKKNFDYDVTLIAYGVRYSYDENVEEKAKQLVHVGLNQPDAKVVQARRVFNPVTGRPGLIKIELESSEVRKEVLKQTGRLRSWQILGPKIFVRGSHTNDMRTNVNSWKTFLKGSNLEHEWDVNPKTGVLFPRQGSQAEANIAIKSQMSQGNPRFPQSQASYQHSNPVYPPQSQPRPTYSYNNNHVYGPPPPSQQPRFGVVNNSVYTSNSTGQPLSYAQAAQTRPVNPLSQFMSGSG